MPQQTVDPRKIPQSKEPLIISCNQNTVTGEVIDFDTDIPGTPPACHSMLSKDQGRLVSQSPSGYNDIPMEEYMVQGTQLMFFTLVNSNPAFVAAFNKSVMDKLDGPWWRKCYNWLQIVGQGLRLPWLSFPGLDDCTMDVVYHLKAAASQLPQADYEIVNGIPNNANPEQFLSIKLNSPRVFNFQWYYDSRTGLII